MRKQRVITVVIGAVLCLGAIATAQDNPRVSTSADRVVREQSGRTILTGNVVLTVDGVTVRADRVVIQNGEATLEGNVRLILPKPVYTAAAMRSRISSEPTPNRIETPKIDTPIPQPWQPPARPR
jgi:lipopolysaccharide assembly outer membrane protein LptD (OstA)